MRESDSGSMAAPTRDGQSTSFTGAPNAHSSALQRHLAMLACPRCRADLRLEGDTILCMACGTHFAIRAGLPDFAPEIPTARDDAGESGQWRMEDPHFTKDYATRWRKLFVTMMGGVLPSRFTYEDEAAYIARFMRPGDGPALDLACGPGQWAQILADIVGPDETIGLDLSPAMLRLARHALPKSLLMRGTVLHLPFKDSSLGTVSCWNSLQLLPEPANVLAEIGRCLRPGGRFYCFTYRKSHGPYRLIQGPWAKFAGVRAPEPSMLREWIAAAGLRIVDESGPAFIFLLAAERPTI